MRRAAILCMAALVVGCGSGSGVLASRSTTSIRPAATGSSARRARAGTSRSSSVRARSFPCLASATHRARRSPSNAGSPSASQFQTRSFVATRQQAQTWPNLPSSQRDSPASPTVLLWSRPTRSFCRTLSPVAASASNAEATHRRRGDREGGGVRGSGLAAAVVAGALQSGVASSRAIEVADLRGVQAGAATSPSCAATGSTLSSIRNDSSSVGRNLFISATTPACACSGFDQSAASTASTNVSM